MRLAFLALLMTTAGLATGCSSMLIGGGTSTDSSIGNDERSSSDRQDDNALSQTVLQALLRDPMLRDERLFAAAGSGVVTLSGTVGSFDARDRAVEIARNTTGVSRVNNQVEVNTRN